MAARLMNSHGHILSAPSPRVSRAEDMRNLVLQSLQRSAMENRKFVPLDVLEDVFTLGNTMGALESNGLDPMLAHSIHQKALKVFAILVLVEQVAKTAELLREGLTDKDLPLGYEVNDGAWAIRSYRHESDILESQTEWKAFRGWSSNTKYNFCERQWMFLAPVFRQEHFDYFLHRDVILPFTKVEPVKKSFFSQVYHVKIHPRHQEALSPVNFMHSQFEEVLCVNSD